jgi:acyl carrier protein
MITADDVVVVLAPELGLSPDAIPVDAAADDIGPWDSLGHVRVCMAIEAAFGVVIDLDSMELVKSIPSIVDFVNAART